MAETVMSSHELHAVMEYAHRLAKRHGRDVTTLHVLIAAVEKRPNMVGEVLANFKVTSKGDNGVGQAVLLLKAQDGVERLQEPPDTLKLIMHRACEMAGSRENPVNTIFYFITMIRLRRALGTRALEALGIDLSRFRSALLARISNLKPLRPNGDDGSEEEEDEVTLVTPAVSPSEPAPRTVPAEPRGEGASEPRKGASEPRKGASEPRKGTSAPPEAKESAEAPPEGDEASYSLDPDEFPELAKSTTNITLRALRGQIDPVIGRDREIAQLINILKKRQINNPCLVGEPGVGKTALVEGLALELVRGSGRTRRLDDRIVLELETAALVAGTQLRGSFSERMLAIRDEVRRLKDRVIIFIDEIHTIIGAGGSDSSPDAANELKTALARGEFPTIGATSRRTRPSTAASRRSCSRSRTRPKPSRSSRESSTSTKTTTAFGTTHGPSRPRCASPCATCPTAGCRPRPSTSSTRPARASPASTRW